jgi:penicillin amidase
MSKPETPAIIEQTLSIPGLAEAATIRIDRWGVPHIKAGSLPDVFLVQGFNAARDRLWQIDLWRKRGLGQLAADFGPGYLRQDEAARLFLYRGDMEPEWEAYAPDAEAICTAFACGVNAYIALAEVGEVPLPPEFGLMDTRPAIWKAEDIVRIRSHCLTRNALSEVLRANVLSKSGERADLLRADLDPPVMPYADEDIALSDIPLAALDLFRLATAAVTFSPERLAATLEEADRWRRVDSIGDVVLAAASEGSNNWAVSGARTATGRPIMAADPHRAHALPGLRYLAHLSAPGLDVIGAGEPGVPGIALGHNGHSAFSITIFGADQEDMLVYETDPEVPNRYCYKGGWREMEVVSESFKVRGHPDQKATLRYTCDGPVVHEEESRAFGVRTVWSDPGHAPYMASLSVMRANSHDEWRAALKGWGTPSINHVYADVTGTIAWQTVGTTPKRGTWNGLLPVSGDGRHQWEGALSLDELPHMRDPDCGFITTSNENNLPKGWDSTERMVGFEWIDRSRAERIRERLSDDPAHSLEAAGKLQNDLFSRAGERVLAVLAGVEFTDEAARAAASLADWDCVSAAESSPALLFEYWITRHLKPACFAAMSEGDGSTDLLWPGSIQSLLDLVERPEAWFSDRPQPQRDQILAETLAAAWGDLSTRYGADPRNWHWGDLHRLDLVHPLDLLGRGETEGWSLPSIPLGGSGSTPNYANYRVGDFQTITGPSVRLLMDVGAWDNCLFINLPGQSGLPDSPHYRDLTEEWLAGNYHPLLWSDTAIEAATETLLNLLPKSEGKS